MKSPTEELTERCEIALQEKGLKSNPAYNEALASELVDIKNWKVYAGEDKAKTLLVRAGKNQTVDTNKSGSLILFLLGISSADPIAMGLPKQSACIKQGDAPDIDTDFDPRYRDEIKSFIVKTFGEDNTCSIGTYGTYKTRAVILDIARALGHDVHEAMELTKSLELKMSVENDEGEEEDASIDKIDWDELIEEFADLRVYFEKYPEILFHARILRNQVKHVGTHAGGVIITDLNLKNKIPVFLDKNGKVVSCWNESGNSTELSSVGLVKFDILGLLNLCVIADCVKLIEKTKGKKLERWEIPIDDKESIRMGSKRDLVGIFQFENPSVKPVVEAVGMDCLEDVSAITSLIRPGPRDMGMDMEYARRKNGEPFEELKCLMDVLPVSRGIMIYQEDIMKISREIAGFNMVDANRLRKACISRDSEFVSKKRGVITLERMMKEGYADDMFLKMGLDGKLEWGGISNIWKTGKKRVRRVKSRSGYFVDATKIHQFLTDDGWKAQQRLEEGDRVVCARYLEWDGRDTISRDFAIVIAGLLTEGYAPKGKTFATFVSHDSEFMDIFVKSFEREFGKENGTLSPDGRVYGIKKNGCERIFKVMAQGLSAEKIIPDEMMGLTKDTTRDFLSFMLGAEGGVGVLDGQFSYSSKSQKMIHQVKTLLLRFGIRSCSGHKDNPEYGRFYHLTINDMQEQNKLLELMYLWPNLKRDNFKFVFERKSGPNFTTDTIPNRIVKRMLNQYPFVGRVESGTLFTAPVSRLRFSRVASLTKDRDWISIAESDFWFDEYKDSDEIVSISTDVYDFTVEQGSPNMVVNGMVIHNCSKKKADVMEVVKKQFLEGAQKKVEAGEMTRSEAETVWLKMASFAKYGFCKAHATAYSAITCAELWLKYNYPIEYIAALINNASMGKKKFGEELFPSYINYARKRGFKVLYPDINMSQDQFTIEPQQNGEEDAIRFSISHVKNVANSAEVVIKNQPYSDMEDFYNRAAEEKISEKTGKTSRRRINKRVVESLIFAGAFDSFGTRPEVLQRYYTLRKDKEFEMPRSQAEWNEKEAEVIGVILSSVPLKWKYAEVIKTNRWCPISETNDRGDRVKVFGRISKIRETTSKKGNRMLVVSLTDDLDSLTFFVFGGSMITFKDVFKEGDVASVPMKKFADSATRFYDVDRDGEIVERL